MAPRKKDKQQESEYACIVKTASRSRGFCKPIFAANVGDNPPKSGPRPSRPGSKNEKKKTNSIVRLSDTTPSPTRCVQVRIRTRSKARLQHRRSSLIRQNRKTKN